MDKQPVEKEKRTYKVGLGTEFCATPNCPITAAMNMALCGSCMSAQSAASDPAEGARDDEEE